MNILYLSVVIPSYDEMANLQKGVLDKIDHFLRKKEFSYEILVVDDGSTDGSREFVKNYTKENKRFRLIENNHMGKAGAVTTGVLEAKGEHILFTDMDQAAPIEQLDKLLPFNENGFDVVIGSRDSSRKGAPLTRQIMAKSAILLRSFLIGLPKIKDTQCGFKLFTRKAAIDIFSKIKKIHNGFHEIKGSSVTAGFDMELLYLSEKLGFSIKEVPIDWLYVETRRVSFIKDSLDGVIDLLKIKKNIIQGVYK